MAERELTRKGTRTVAFATTADSPPIKFCDRHETAFSRVHAGDREIERAGVTYTLKPSVTLLAFSECVNDHLRDVDTVDASDRELLVDAIREDWNQKAKPGQMDRALFDVEAVDLSGVPVLACPLCLERRSEVEPGVIDCSVHGRYRVDIAAVEETPTP